MPRPKTLPDEDILRALRAVFLRKGEGVGTRLLAEAVGLSQAALIQRFGTKGALFQAAMAPKAIDPHKALSPAASLPNVLERLTKLIGENLPAMVELSRALTSEADAMDAAHKALGVPLLRAVLAEKVGELRARGVIANPVSDESLADALLVIAHGFTAMGMASPGRHPMPRRAFIEIAAVLSASGKPGSADNA